MEDRRQTYGRAAEAAAEAFLRRKGYRILDKNVRSSLGELDLVAEQHGVVVFVEVKARRTDAMGGAAHAVTGRKQAKLIRLAGQYLSGHRLGARHCRFDVLLCRGGECRPDAIEHIENAFEVPGGELQG